MIMLWGGSTAAGVTIPLPCWCYELTGIIATKWAAPMSLMWAGRSLQKRASSLPISSGC